MLTTADAISVLGDQIGLVALLWFVMVTTNQSTNMGLLALGFGLPGVLLGAVVGNVLDRWPRKMVLVGANVILGIIFTAIPYLHSIQRLSMVTLMALIVAAGCIIPFITVGWMVMLPNVVSTDDLGIANSINETLWQAASLIGPLAGGVLVTKLGAPVAILLDGFSFLGAALCLLLIKDPQPKRIPRETLSNKSSFWLDAWSGFKYLYSTKAVWWITLGALFLNMAYGQLEVALPLFVHHELMSSAVVLGSLWMVYFISSICGAAASGFVRFPLRQGTLMAFMVIGWGVSLLPLIWFHSVWVGYITMALAGFLFAGYIPMARTAVQRLIPAEYQGRVFGLRTSIIGLGVPIGSYLSGIIAQWVLPSSLIGFTGAAIMILGVLLMLIREFRSI
ncbi:MFS transporter [Collibacillus ludicampi]|uniref:MFS transporter n=1 Tax=Collibacillus ludicampi TaxID=2771369 RepID=A0AAV4LG66_9BACL|nr:MFS transporter [Collibacillus ludicampi]